MSRLPTVSCGPYGSAPHTVVIAHPNGYFSLYGHLRVRTTHLQIGQEDNMFLLDFDRGKIMSPGPWRQKNIGRLHRSLRKIKQAQNSIHYSEADWNQLLEGYFSASRSA